MFTLTMSPSADHCNMVIRSITLCTVSSHCELRSPAGHCWLSITEWSGYRAGPLALYQWWETTCIWRRQFLSTDPLTCGVPPLLPLPQCGIPLSLPLPQEAIPSSLLPPPLLLPCSTLSVLPLCQCSTTAMLQNVSGWARLRCLVV